VRERGDPVIHAILHQVHDPLVAALPVFAVFIAIEAVAYLFERDEPSVGRGYSAIDSRTSIAMGLGALTVGFAFRAASLVGFTALYVYVAPWHAPADLWWTWVILFFLVDFLWYWYHRISHRVRLVWAAHQAHHSSEYFNFSTALRQKWNQWFEVLIWIPLPLLGMPPSLIYAVFSLNLIYQFFVHTERIDKLPRPIEFIFNTPSHHRVHHGSDQIYLDRNYGGILILWDRLFGTFQAELHRPKYGLTTPVGTYNIIRLQFHEYAAILRDLRQAHSWGDRLGYIFGPPGWQPTTSDAGSSERSSKRQWFTSPWPRRADVR
jgi:sterol desaturase/sphingolipid hydroxylase (fatty acid hydroxylase superfamily)